MGSFREFIEKHNLEKADKELIDSLRESYYAGYNDRSELSNATIPWTTPKYIGIDWKDFNSMPEPYKEINVDEFLRLMCNSSYSPTGMYYQLIKLPDVKFYFNVWFWHFPLYAVAGGVIRSNKADLQNWHTYVLPYNGNYNIDDRLCTREGLKFWKIGCEHEFKELSSEECRVNGLYHSGNCFHTMCCIKCQYIWSYDSSE